MTFSEYNDNLLSLWNRYSQKCELPTDALYPIQHDERDQNDSKLLIIGCNPSFSGDKAFDSIMKYDRLDALKQKGLSIDAKTKSEKIEQMKSLFAWDTKPDGDLISAMKFMVGRARMLEFGLNYFAKFSEISKYVGFTADSWIHVDLFGWHGTNQKQVEDLATKKHVNFFNDQFELSCDLLKSLKGVNIILFNNAFASSYFAEHCRNFEISLEDSEFEQKGYDMVKTPRWNAPIFFSGMLSGQRALDLRIAPATEMADETERQFFKMIPR